MKKFFVILVLALLCQHLLAQHLTYIGVEGGTHWNMLKPNQAQLFSHASVPGSLGGIYLGQEIGRNLNLMVGAVYLAVNEGVDLVDKRPHTSRQYAYSSLMFPLRAEFRVQPTTFPLSFSPRLGYVFGLVSREGGYSTSSFIWGPNEEALRYDMQQIAGEDRLHMMEIGLSVGLRFAGAWQGNLSLSYLKGFSDPGGTSIRYLLQDGSSGTVNYSSGGNLLYSSFSINMPISHIWQNRDFRIRKRIEQGSYEGKAVEKRGRFYLGAEGGSLWRSFFSNNPAIGARPMTNKVPFRFANFHGGLYAGMMLQENLGLDIGVLYQRSSLFYTSMYDHDINLLVRASAPLFLEIPLRLRYWYDVYKGKVFTSVYGGASLLTHFSRGEYASGSREFSYRQATGTGSANATSRYSATRIRQYVPVLRFGAGIEYVLPMDFPMIATCYLSYLNGFLSTDELVVVNDFPEQPSENRIHYKGSGWSLDIGIRIPLRFSKKGICEDLPERTE